MTSPEPAGMRFELPRAIEVLRATPGCLRELCAGLGPEWTHAGEGPGTFSAFDSIGHLIDGEETDWMPRARLIRSASKQRRFEPYDRFRHRDRNRGRSLASLLEEFARLREANLAELEGWSLTDADLGLTGEHPEFGTVTLRQLLATWVVHDLGHIAQVARVMAKQYRGEIGPWAAYLPVVSDRPR